jgi:hypothetical protein
VFSGHTDEKIGVLKDSGVGQMVVADENQHVEIRSRDFRTHGPVHLVDLGFGVFGGAGIQPSQTRSVTRCDGENDVSHGQPLPSLVRVPLPLAM